MDSEVQLIIALLSIAGAVIGLVGALIGRRQVVVVHAQPSGADVARPGPVPQPPVAGAATTSWHDHPGWILFWLGFFWPVGLYALGRSRWVKGSWKTGAVVALGVLFLIGVMA